MSLDLWKIVLARHKQIAAAIDAKPALRGAGIIVVADGKAMPPLRASHHASRLPTYVVIEVAEKSATELTQDAIRRGTKALIDSVFKVDDQGGSAYDAMCEVQAVTFGSTHFQQSILPKMTGVALGALGLVIAIPAAAAAAGLGTVALLCAAVGSGSAVAGFTASVAMLVTEIVDPNLAAVIEAEPWFGKFQSDMELLGIASGIGGASAGLRKSLAFALGSPKALLAIRKGGRMTPAQLTARVQGLSDAELVQLCAALQGSRARRAQYAAKHLMAVRAGDASRTKLAALAIRGEFVAELRRDFRVALFADLKTVQAHLKTTVPAQHASYPLHQAPPPSWAKTHTARTLTAFGADRATQLSIATSALPASIVGNGSGLVNAHARAIQQHFDPHETPAPTGAAALAPIVAADLARLTFYVAQDKAPLVRAGVTRG